MGGMCVALHVFSMLLRYFLFLHWWCVSCSTNGVFSVLLHGLGISLPEYFKNRDNKITHNVKIAFFLRTGKDLAKKIKMIVIEITVII